MKPINMLQPNRKITGMSAILLPFTDAGEVDWPGLEAHVARTAVANLIPAVNMDTGYANLIDEDTRQEVLRRTQAIMDGKMFVAGAFVADQPGAAFNLAAYAQQIEQIQAHGGTPIIFQSFGLTGGVKRGLSLSKPGLRQAQSSSQIDVVVAAYEQIAAECDQFIAFELGNMFAPFGAIYDLDAYAGLMAIPNCIGAKHSSLRRELEWQRLQLRDVQRPDFMVLTGNDLAIDMVMYGSDYLLGLSTFAPDLFAKRDAYWQAGDPAFYELNDILQYLGFFAFRAPVPAYKHSAAQFLKLRGWIDCDHPHPQAHTRPDSDVAILQEILTKLEQI
ncbi:MAG: dihydrodipicolinate synthase family protein [Anaerolineae bacterium]|nr:dihydrodipicolinate synthase family protein [Anaerolineae bacterium]